MARINIFVMMNYVSIDYMRKAGKVDFKYTKIYDCFGQWVVNYKNARFVRFGYTSYGSY